MRRLPAIALTVGGALVGLTVAAVLALALTGPGRRLVRDVALRRLQAAVDGTAHLGSVRLLSWHTVEARDLALEGADGRPVLSAARVRATVGLLDLIRGRIVLRDVQVARPVVTLRQDSAGRWNVERLFRLTGPDRTARGPRPFVELRDARVTEGALTLLARGAARPVRVGGIELDLRRVRASDPGSTAILVDVRNLAARVQDPSVRVKRAHGDLVVDADSVQARFDLIELAGSLLKVRGTLHTGGAHPVFDVTANASRFRFEDVAWISPQLPRTGGGSLTLRAHRSAEGGGAFELGNVDVTSGASRIRGSLRFTTGAGDASRVEAMDLTAAPLDLALLAPFVPALPLHGEVRGTVRGSGPMSALDVAAELAFTDAALADHPVSTLSARGRLALGGPAAVTFRGFTLRPADVSLATVEGIAPAVNLHGRLRLDGTLDGPWRDATFAGTLVHRDGEGPASTARGSARLTLADTVRVAADLAADSLSFDDLARSYPGLPLHGAVAGHLSAVGPVTALAVDADVAGPAGHVVLTGTVGAQAAGALVRLRGRFDRVDLAAHFGWAPPTSLAGAFASDLVVPTGDSAGPVTGTLHASLDSSRAAGIDLVRAGFGATLGARAIVLDTVFVDHVSASLEGGGSLGRPGEAPGEIRLTAHADTLAAFAPVVRWIRKRSGDTTTAPVDLDGAGRLAARISGTTAAWSLEGELDVPDFSLADLAVRALHLEAGYATGPGGERLRLKASADSLATSGLSYTAVRVVAEGRRDSVSARVEASLPAAASLSASGIVGFDSAGTRIRLDSATLRLPSATWTLARPARVAITADSVEVDSLDLRSPAGGRLLADGTFSTRGSGAFNIVADSVPLSDLWALAERDTAGVGGSVSVAAEVTGSAANPAIEAYVTLANGRFGNFRTPLVDGLFRYGDHLLTVKGGLWRDSVRVLGVRGSLPLDLSLGSVPHRQLPGPLEIRIEADSADLSALNAFTALIHDVSGKLTADLGVRGTWDQPALTGSAVVRGAAFTFPALGERWQDIDVRLETSGNRIHVAEARLRSGGTLDVAGDIVLQDLTRPVLDLTIDARGFQAFNKRDFAGLTGTGSLRLVGPFHGARLSGDLTVDEGFLAFADLVEKRIVNLDDPEFRSVVDSSLARAALVGPAAEVVFLDSLRIDGMRVTMGKSVWLRSSEANIQLAGDMTVSKTTESTLNPYRLDGTLRAVRGTYRLSVYPTMKEFEVTRGEVRFFGTPDLDPQLDIVAEHTVRTARGNDLVVRALIGGTLREPVLTLESDQRPPLTETEIVSYLLFGRPSFDLIGATPAGRSEQSVLQGAATGLAFAGLAGLAAGQLEQTLVGGLGLPLDYIAIRPGSAGDVLGTTRIEAGRQIGERTFLTLKVPLCEVVRGISSQLFGVTIAYRLSPSWRVEASVEPLLQECRALGVAPQPSTPYQIGVDLFWQQGIQ